MSEPSELAKRWALNYWNRHDGEVPQFIQSALDEHDAHSKAEIERLLQQLAAAQLAIGVMGRALSFATSAIKCGEPWTETCESLIGLGFGTKPPELYAKVVECLQMCKANIENMIRVDEFSNRGSNQWPDVLTGCVSGGGINETLAALKGESK